MLAAVGGLSLSCTALALPRGRDLMGATELAVAAMNYLAVLIAAAGVVLVVAGAMVLAGRAGARGPLLVSAALMLSTFIPQFPVPPKGWVELAWFWGSLGMIGLLFFPDARRWFDQPRYRRGDGRAIPQMPLTVSVPLTVLWTGIAVSLLFAPFPFHAIDALRASGMDGSEIAQLQMLTLVGAAWSGLLGFLSVSVARRSRVGLRLLIGAVVAGGLFQVVALAVGPATVGLPGQAGMDSVQAGIGFGSVALSLALLAIPRSRGWCTESAWRAPLYEKREAARERRSMRSRRRARIRAQAAEYRRNADAERKKARAHRLGRWRRLARRMPSALASVGRNLVGDCIEAVRNAAKKERHLTEEGVAALMTLGAVVVVVLLVVVTQPGR
ncbi:hypothetical protein [Glycomyces buryatensis]|uniref:hypothetical protein n=1 Tax=Glycomyces buryatensis TaxID=2570927 RepID=UPI00145627A5|nr:hypothetical protein [Glycomyces buryatensis]